MDYLTLKNAIFLRGLRPLGILSAGLVMTKVLNWNTELKKIDTLSEHIIWTHGAYVCFHGLTLNFAYFTLVYGWATYEGIMR